MADIQRINSDDLQQCMAQYRSAKAVLQDSHAAFMRSISALNSDWTGRAYNIMQVKVNVMNNNIQRSFNNIEDALNELSAVIQLATETEGSIKGKIASQDIGTESPFNAG